MPLLAGAAMVALWALAYVAGKKKGDADRDKDP